MDEVAELFGHSYTPDILKVRLVMDAIDGYMSLAMGLLAYAIVVGIPLVTAFDLFYIMNPAARNKITNLNRGKAGAIRFITNDAISAIEESALSNASSVSVYVKKRIKTYILTAIILTLLIGGMWDIVVRLITKFVTIIVFMVMSIG